MLLIAKVPKNYERKFVEHWVVQEWINKGNAKGYYKDTMTLEHRPDAILVLNRLREINIHDTYRLIVRRRIIHEEIVIDENEPIPESEKPKKVILAASERI